MRTPWSAGSGEGSRYHLAQMGSALIKWEGHTEADSMTCLVPGNGSPLFGEAASQFAPSELIMSSEATCSAV